MQAKREAAPAGGNRIDCADRGYRGDVMKGGMPLPTILFVVFLILKLNGGVAWSWVWVTSPLWITAILVVLAYFFAFMFMFRNAE